MNEPGRSRNILLAAPADPSPQLAIESRSADQIRPDKVAVGVIVWTSLLALVPNKPLPRLIECWLWGQFVGVMMSPEECYRLIFQPGSLFEWLIVALDFIPISR